MLLWQRLCLSQVCTFPHARLYELTALLVGLHRPDISKKALIITIISAGFWFADKSLRLSRWIYHGAGNYCILTPLAENATRVTMRHHMTAQLGSMAFL